MKKEYDDDGDEGVQAAGEEGRTVISNDDGVVSDPNDGEDEHDHERSQPPKRGAELEHVPRHHRPRSVHHCQRRNQTNLEINSTDPLQFQLNLNLIIFF